MSTEVQNTPSGQHDAKLPVSGCVHCLERIDFLKKQRENEPFPKSYFTLKAITILELKVKGIYRCGRGAHCR